MRIFPILLMLLFFGCDSAVTKEQLTQLNGYWEIDKVVLSDGYEKEYTINTVVDYFMFADMSGYRKKVQPLLDGTFDTSDDAQTFEIIANGEKFELHYKNELSEWTETIETLDATSLILANTEGVVYYYKKFESLNIDKE